MSLASGRSGWAFVLAATAVSYRWLDRPIAFFAHDQTQQFHIFEQLTLIPEFLVPIAVVFVTAFGLWALSGRPLTRFESVLTLAGASLAVAELTKDQLQYVFGRTWPETWVRNNPSLIKDGVYGFNPFHGGPGLPHSHRVTPPRFAPSCLSCGSATHAFGGFTPARLRHVAIGLIGANFHFLSDVIAGGFLGISIGWFTVTGVGSGCPAGCERAINKE